MRFKDCKVILRSYESQYFFDMREDFDLRNLNRLSTFTKFNHVESFNISDNF